MVGSPAGDEVVGKSRRKKSSAMRGSDGADGLCKAS